MKKWGLVLILSLLFSLAPLTAYARAGGSTGGGGGSTGGGGTSTGGNSSHYHDDDDYYHHRYTRSNPYMDIIIFGSFGMLIFVPKIRRGLQKQQVNRVHPQNTMPMPADLQAEFEPFFYQVETAWTHNDQATLQQLMVPRYFKKQRKILDGYTKKHKIDQLEGLVIIELAQVLTDSPSRLQVVVTAQARDYFQYDNQSAAYNQNIYEQAYIERFTEVWELSRQADHRLVLKQIRQ
ncbi:hypothetical protein [Lactiplantibacillus daowaiensis]|uniref:Tim44-like domain-containing protein n=1 Tax=Lactiplantibacillus daowaiensis TaxID=2559918 RepID=A0ABW1S2V8_9LACO|nr:hypothetical protein [Lactiplantibacillus daowaiensis]